MIEFNDARRPRKSQSDGPGGRTAASQGMWTILPDAIFQFSGDMSKYMLNCTKINKNTENNLKILKTKYSNEYSSKESIYYSSI